jgi:hypothetical protein
MTTQREVTLPSRHFRLRMRSPTPPGWAGSRLALDLEAYVHRDRRIQPTCALSRSAGDRRAWLALARSTAVALV